MHTHYKRIPLIDVIHLLPHIFAFIMSFQVRTSECCALRKLQLHDSVLSPITTTLDVRSSSLICHRTDSLYSCASLSLSPPSPRKFCAPLPSISSLWAKPQKVTPLVSFLCFSFRNII